MWLSCIRAFRNDCGKNSKECWIVFFFVFCFTYLSFNFKCKLLNTEGGSITVTFKILSSIRPIYQIWYVFTYFKFFLILEKIWKMIQLHTTFTNLVISFTSFTRNFKWRHPDFSSVFSFPWFNLVNNLLTSINLCAGLEGKRDKDTKL